MNSSSLAFDVNDIASVNAMLNSPDITGTLEPTPVPAPKVSEPVEAEPRSETPKLTFTFREIATPIIARNVPVIPLRPASKIAFLSNWTELASTDPTQIAAWDMENPDANGACVAKAVIGGNWFFELDKPGLRKKIEEETGMKFPETFTVSSSPGKGHFYFKQTLTSIALGNRQGADADGETWSARVDDRYVVAPLSTHPTSKKLYEVVSDAPIIPAPDWLVAWCLKNDVGEMDRVNGVRVNASPDGPPIPRGRHDIELFRIACSLRNAGLGYELIKDNLVGVCEQRCVDHGSDYVDMCEKKAAQAVKYPVGSATPRAVLGSAAGAAGTAAAVDVEIPVISQIAYPEFPRWVMGGTSLYDGFIKPICAANTRFPEFMFMPSVTLMLNYLAFKVTIKSNPNLIPSFWMVSVGKKGRVMKSACVNDSIAYFRSIGIIGEGNDARIAEGKSLIWTAGSTEGLGMEMTRTNCKSAVLFYDELGVMTSKMKIEASSMAKHLSIMYESGSFGNVIKAKKENFNFPPGSYCASIIACNAEKTFLANMGPILKACEGMDERWFYLYQPDPKAWPVNKAQRYVNTVVGAQETKKRIDQAIIQGVFEIDDFWEVLDEVSAVNNRTAIRVAKLALYFAVDLGKKVIDDDCLARAKAVAEYDLAVKAYLQVPEAATLEGQIQSEIINFLVRNQGRVTRRQLDHRMHPERYGTSLWNKVYQGLLHNHWTAEQGTGMKGDPKTLVLLRVPEQDDD